MNRTAFWTGLGILLLGGVWAVTWTTSQKSVETEDVAREEAQMVRDTDQVKGSREARVVLVEYSDFQCPACQFYAEWISQLAESFGEDIAIVYRHFPLRSIHQQAELAALASEAASKQGMFWEYHDLLFERQKDWAGNKNARDLFVSYALMLNLNEETFVSDIEDLNSKEKVRRDLAEGESLGVRGTPTFYLQGKSIQNPRTYAEFEQYIIGAFQEQEE
ncbi:MAG: thioredoxin domain-containing protein [bacterium]|nr:thioredoxin domain-containing protein [bacterium]